jgi:hypothetical protein
VNALSLCSVPSTTLGAVVTDFGQRYGHCRAGGQALNSRRSSLTPPCFPFFPWDSRLVLEEASAIRTGVLTVQRAVLGIQGPRQTLFRLGSRAKTKDPSQGLCTQSSSCVSASVG